MKKERVKGFVSGIVTTAIVFSLVGTAAATIGSRTLTADYNDIKIALNGKQITPADANGNPVEPFTVNGTTYLPVRAVGNALGVDVSWDGVSNTVLLETNDTSSYSAQACKDNLVELGIYKDIQDAAEYGQFVLDTAQSEMAYVGRVSNDSIIQSLNKSLNERLPQYVSRLDDISEKLKTAKATCTNIVVTATLNDFATVYLNDAYSSVNQIKAAINSMIAYTNNPSDSTYNAYTDADTDAFTSLNTLHSNAYKKFQDTYSIALKWIDSILSEE